jgi:hypothetical protein
MLDGTRTEGISPRTAEGMPVGDCKFEMFLHGFPSNDPVGIIVAKSHWIVTFLSFELNLPDLGKK